VGELSVPPADLAMIVGVPVTVGAAGLLTSNGCITMSLLSA
jgi:hypothetical protein